MISTFPGGRRKSEEEALPSSQQKWLHQWFDYQQIHFKWNKKKKVNFCSQLDHCSELLLSWKWSISQILKLLKQFEIHSPVCRKISLSNKFLKEKNTVDENISKCTFTVSKTLKDLNLILCRNTFVLHYVLCIQPFSISFSPIINDFNAYDMHKLQLRFANTFNSQIWA